MNGLVRLNSDGSLDNGTGASSYIKTTSLQEDGKIISGGEFTSYDGILRNRIARVDIDGGIDETFDPGTGFNTVYPGFHDQDVVHASAIQGDGEILVGGYFPSYDGIARNSIVRINTAEAWTKVLTREQE